MESLSVATSILTRAVTLDKSGRYTEALVCYQEGLHILIENIKTLNNDDERKGRLRAKVEEYMDRGEKLKVHIEELKNDGKYKEQIKIEENSINHSYHSVFSRFLDSSVRNIEVDDSYIRSLHQCDNFVRFLELALKLCPNLKTVTLKTGPDSNQFNQQSQRLNTIKKSCRDFDAKRNVELLVEYSESIHDREIRIDNGWVVKIGRGLDYFKAVDRFTIGCTDFDLRPCKETTVDVFHRKELTRCH